MNVKNTLIIFSLLLTPSVYAAGYDCEKANGFIENAVCTNDSLSSLDDDLSWAYTQALDEAAHPAEIKKAQRDWLINVRNSCKSVKCLDSAYHQRIDAVKKHDKYSWNTFIDKKLGISFAYPSNRTIQVDYGAKRVKIVGPTMSGDDYVVAFAVGRGNLRKAISESDIFERRHGKWVANIGPGENDDAEEISEAGWKGIKTIIACGVEDKETGIRATGECLWAVFSNGHRYAVANTQGSVEIDERLLRTMKSFEFVE
jgi:uncharacterized protein